jgi:hypothetical protein
VDFRCFVTNDDTLRRRRGYDKVHDVGTASIGVDKRNSTIAEYSIAETIMNIILFDCKKVSTVNANRFTERGDTGDPFRKSGDRWSLSKA